MTEEQRGEAFAEALFGAVNSFAPEWMGPDEKDSLFGKLVQTANAHVRIANLARSPEASA